MVLALIITYRRGQRRIYGAPVIELQRPRLPSKCRCHSADDDGVPTISWKWANHRTINDFDIDAFITSNLQPSTVL
nr:hypothetical protein [Salmonid herpesvirus 1]